jgi:hypothetical protein
LGALTQSSGKLPSLLLAGALLARATLACAAAQPSSPAQPLDESQAAVAALVESWSGVYDDEEQVIFDERGVSPLVSDDKRRIRTIVAPVVLPWLGTHVLYLEEFPQDDPEDPRRQVLLALAPEPSAFAGSVRVRQLTFREPERWRRLYEREELIERLRRSDLAYLPGCDLLLTRDGEQFRGGTLGRGCIDSSRHPRRYVDYQLLTGGGLNWYRKRLYRLDDDELVSETVGFDWFELHDARLFACRIRWSRSGRPADLLPLTSVDLHDQGGRVRFTTPDGHAFELELHSGDWPFDANRDALILVVRELGPGAPLASSWAGLDSEDITVSLGAVDVRCGPVAPLRDVTS